MAARRIHSKLEDRVPAQRGELITALLLLARSWYAAGCPVPEKALPRMGGFQEWVNTVGGMLLFVGLTNFLDNLNDLYAQADSDTLQWAAFLHAWHNMYGERGVLVAEIVKDIKVGSQESTVPGAELFNALPDELTEIYKGDFRRKLGKALSSRVGSLFDDSGLHLEKGEVDRRNGTTYWKVADVRISRIAIPQKEDFFITNYPPQGLPGEERGISDANIFPSGEVHQSAKSAYPQKREAGR